MYCVLGLGWGSLFQRRCKHGSICLSFTHSYFTSSSRSASFPSRGKNVDYKTLLTISHFPHVSSGNLDMLLGVVLPHNVLWPTQIKSFLACTVTQSHYACPARLERCYFDLCRGMFQYMCNGCLTGGNSTPYCNQNNMMSSHHNFCQIQPSSDQIGSGDGNPAVPSEIRKCLYDMVHNHNQTCCSLSPPPPRLQILHATLHA